MKDDKPITYLCLICEWSGTAKELERSTTDLFCPQCKQKGRYLLPSDETPREYMQFRSISFLTEIYGVREQCKLKRSRKLFFIDQQMEKVFEDQGVKD